MNVEDLKRSIEKKLRDIESEMDFKFKDIIKMKEDKQKRSKEIVRRRNELLGQLNLLETYNRKRYNFDEKRYSMHRNLNNEELLEAAFKAKIDGDFAGGREYVACIERYESMRNEFAWRIQNSIDVIKNVRYCKEYNMDQLFVEDKEDYSDQILDLCQETYQIADLQSFISNLSETNLNSSYVKFGNSIIGGILYDNSFNIKALVVKENYRCCGVGTKLLYDVYEKAKKVNKYVTLYALPKKCSYFLLKNDFLLDTDKKDGEFEIYESEHKEEQIEIDENEFI